MSLRMSPRLPASRAARRRRIAWVTSIIMAAGLVQASPLPVRAAGGDNEPAVQKLDTPAPARPAPPVRPRKADKAAKLAATVPAVNWPTAGTAALALHGRTPAKASIGGLAVTVTPTAGKTAAKIVGAPASGAAAVAPAAVQVQTLDRAASTAAGVDGPVLKVARADGAGDAGAPFTLSVGYRSFAGAYGGDFGARLRLVRLPDCALTTPQQAACKPQPVPTRNDAEAATVSATVTAGTRQSLFALAAAESSSQGDYGATALAPSAKWSVSPSSGGYSWEYPITAPQVPGGQVPGVALAYNSQTVDGRTTTTNNQGSWVGEGFSYEPGYVERQFNACRDDGHDLSPDLCWAYDNATIMLNGRSNTLIRDGKDGWRFGTDDGSKIERVKGPETGEKGGESWLVTTGDGTRYHFGLNRLPGWTVGKEETASRWTVPVFGDDKSNAEDDKQEPCYDAAFTKAWCDQVWRWNLDHVVDVHGNVTSYFYGKEDNFYALGGKLDVKGTRYTRGGFLKRIDYGQRAGTVYATAAPARVVFDTKERCLPTATFACKETDLKAATAASWQDTPFDRICAPDVKCGSSQLSPSFFTRKRLSGITTQVRAGTTWVPVDGWAFDHIFTNNGDGSRTLWLHTITHSGYGGTSIPLTLPTVTLDPLQLPNRIDIPGDNIAELVRPRLSTVYTESGAQIDVNYAKPNCAAGALPKEGQSTKRCYPVKWSPGGEAKPITDWFHKYVVEQVIETDRVGGSPDQVTRYNYLGDAGWRYADANGLSKDEKDYLTWNQWRGYEDVVVTEGDGQTMPTKSRHTFLRGLDGDKDPNGGTRSVTREDSTGVKYTDTEEFSGFEIETDVYDGSDVVSKSTTSPWLHETASVKHAWGADRATFVLPEVSHGLMKLANGDWRETKAVTSYEAGTGRVTRVDDRGDLSTAADDRCTRTYYAENVTPGGPTVGIRNLVSRKETVAVGCAATPNRATDVIADERTFYDGKGFGVAATTGNATHTEKLAGHDGTTANYVTVADSTFDQFGRPLVVNDAAGTTTSMKYTEANGLTISKEETGPLGKVVTEYAPTSAQPTAQVDMNNRRTDLAYDKLGRLASVWLPDRPKSGPANVKYTYSFVKDKPVHVMTEKIKVGETYRAEYQIYDGFLRPRQVQAEGPDGGRLVADTFYTSTGKVAKVNDTYYAAGGPSGVILPSRNGDVDGQTAYVYDGADRVTNAITLRAGDEKWRTVTRYDGVDRVSVDPPTGGTPTTTVTDARGQTVELLQYKGPEPTGAADNTHYTYTDAGQLASVTDPAGNVWRHAYDQRGREVKTVDPDAGTSTSVFDDLDRLVSTTDARGVTLTNKYDSIGRKTAVYQGDEKTGTMLSSWAYDTVAKGELYSSTRYVNGNKYEVSTPRLDALNRPLETDYSIPKADVGDKLGGLYRFFTVYNSDGTVQSSGFPAAGGMAAEAVAYTYDSLQRVTKVQGKNTYATAMTYAQTGELLKAELSTGGRKAWATAAYEQGTKRLMNAGVTRQAVIVPGGPPDTTPVNDVDQKYTYDDAGNVLSIEDTPASGQRDIQCFGYDYLRRMKEAWTSASTADKPCAGGPNETGVGGVAPYHESYTFDSTGNRMSRTSHAFGDTPESSQEYTYPAAKSGRPHAVTSMTEKTTAGERLNRYDYDAAGNTTTRNRVGEEQNLTWDPEGHLASVTEAGKTTSFVYSADGQRLVRKEPTTTTVYLAGMELRLNTASTALSGTRFYPVSGQAMVVRTEAGLQFQFADSHGTGQVAVDAVSGAITQRRMDPFGNPRGTQPEPGVWSGEKGFVGGNQDTSTGLTQLGARLYDSQTARFISVDPLIDPYDPQSMNAYAYANNSPVTFSDPDGLKACSDDNCGPGADFVDLNGDYHSVPGHNDGCNGCSGASDPSANDAAYVSHKPRASHSSGTSSTKSREQLEAEARVRKAKEMLVEAGKALGQIVMDELGITDALACVTKGDLGACAETVLNIAGSFVGGVVAKLARKYGAPWKWKKAAELGRKLWDLGAKIVNGIKTWMKESKLARALSESGTCLNSFRAGTRVLMANGRWKRIEELKVGDAVVATDPVKRRTTAKKVTATHVNVDAEFTDLRVVDSAGRESTVHTTQHHPFWNATTRSWSDAGVLRAGNLLHARHRAHVRVVSVRNFVDEAVMYNLTVDDIHTYYVVAGVTPVLVHNCGVSFGPKQLTKKFDKHASDFDVTGNNNAANRSAWQKAMEDHVDAERTVKIDGTYRGNAVTHHLNLENGRNVIADPHGNFVSGWKLNDAQFNNVSMRGSL